MSLNRIAATARIARQLKEAEQKADHALLALAELMVTLVQARGEADIAPHTGQTALVRLVHAQRSIIEGSSDLFRVHDGMAKLGRELGVLDERKSTPPSGLGEGAGSAQAAA
jgi:hypothetical protein